MIFRHGATKLLHPRLFRKPIVHFGRSVSTDASIKQTLSKEPVGQMDQRFQEFQLRGKVFAVTGGGRGLGLAMAEALVEAGGEGM
jgi:hypothetical protein